MDRSPATTTTSSPSSLLVASLSPFPNAICNSSPYFFELVVVLPSDPAGRRETILNCTGVQATWDRGTRLSRVYARASLRANRNCEAYRLFLEYSSRVMITRVRLLKYLADYYLLTVVLQLEKNNEIKSFATSLSLFELCKLADYALLFVAKQFEIVKLRNVCIIGKTITLIAPLIICQFPDIIN